jgi:hypothetical protein
MHVVHLLTTVLQWVNPLCSSFLKFLIMHVVLRYCCCPRQTLRPLCHSPENECSSPFFLSIARKTPGQGREAWAGAMTVVTTLQQ